MDPMGAIQLDHPHRFARPRVPAGWRRVTSSSVNVMCSMRPLVAPDTARSSTRIKKPCSQGTKKYFQVEMSADASLSAGISPEKTWPGYPPTFSMSTVRFWTATGRRGSETVVLVPSKKLMWTRGSLASKRKCLLSTAQAKSPLAGTSVAAIVALRGCERFVKTDVTK
eukprot:6190262-Pleurochrysis_carterae.AAC.4